MASTGAAGTSGVTIAVVTLTFRWTDPMRLAVGALGVVYALAALVVAQVPGATTYSGRSSAAGGLAVMAGLSLIIGGLIVTSLDAIRTLGDLAILAGFTWFAPAWEGWTAGPPVVRSLGMFVSAFVPLSTRMLWWKIHANLVSSFCSVSCRCFGVGAAVRRRLGSAPPHL